MSRHNVIGLDLSLTATGMCAPFAGCDPEPVVIRTNSKDPLGRRMACIASAIQYELDTLSGDGSVELAVVEDLPTHAHGAGKTGTVHGVVHLLLFQHAIPTVTVPPATLKVWATGRGNAGKSDIRMETFKRYGVDLDDDNAADAFQLWTLGAWLLGDPIVDLPQTHTRALDKLHVPALKEAS